MTRGCKVCNKIESTDPEVSFHRYFWCLRILQQVRLYSGMSTYLYKIIILLLNTLAVIIISIFILDSVLDQIECKVIPTLIKHAEYTIEMLFMVGVGHVQLADLRENLVVVPITYICLGFVLQLVMLIQGMEIWVKYFSVESKQTTIFNSANAFMRYNALPQDLRKRIHLYFDFKYQGHFYKETVIQRITSPALKKEIHLSVTKESIQRVAFFEHCSAEVLNKIRAVLISEIFLPGDVIISSGFKGNCMFCILAGTVVITNEQNMEMCYLRDGSHFGEYALIAYIPRCNVIAVTPCELFRLDRASFWDVIKSHPELFEYFSNMVTQRLALVSNDPETASIYLRDAEENKMEVDVDLNYTDVCQLGPAEFTHPLTDHVFFSGNI